MRAPSSLYGPWTLNRFSVWSWPQWADCMHPEGVKTFLLSLWKTLPAVIRWGEILWICLPTSVCYSQDNPAMFIFWNSRRWASTSHRPGSLSHSIDLTTVSACGRIWRKWEVCVSVCVYKGSAFRSDVYEADENDFQDLLGSQIGWTELQQHGKPNVKATKLTRLLLFV